MQYYRDPISGHVSRPKKEVLYFLEDRTRRKKGAGRSDADTGVRAVTHLSFYCCLPCFCSHLVRRGLTEPQTEGQGRAAQRSREVAPVLRLQRPTRERQLGSSRFFRGPHSWTAKEVPYITARIWAAAFKYPCAKKRWAACWAIHRRLHAYLVCSSCSGFRAFSSSLRCQW